MACAFLSPHGRWPLERSWVDSTRGASDHVIGGVRHRCRDGEARRSHRHHPDKAIPCQTTAWQPRRWLASMVACVAMPRRRESRHRVVSSGEVVRRPVCRCEVAGGVRWSTNAFVCALPTMRVSMAVLGNAVSHAGISGRHERTKCMRKTRSIGHGIERWEGNEAQIPGTKTAL